MKLPFFPVLFQQEACESRLYAHHRALTSLSGVLTKTVSSRQQTTKVVADHWSHNQSLQLLVPNQLLGRLRSYQHLNTNSNTWIGPLETALLVSGCDQFGSLISETRDAATDWALHDIRARPAAILVKVSMKRLTRRQCKITKVKQGA
jgi:hypothetical protein